MMKPLYQQKMLSRLLDRNISISSQFSFINRLVPPVPKIILPIILLLCSIFPNSLAFAEDLILTGNQQMVIENTTYTQTGNIFIQDNAKLTIKNATLILNVSYHEEYVVEVSGSGTLEIVDSTIDISIPGENVLMHFLDQSTLIATNNDMQKGRVYLIFGREGQAQAQLFKGNASISNTKFQCLLLVIAPFGGCNIHVSNSVPNVLAYEFRDGYTGSFSNLRPGYYTLWKYNEYGYNLTIEQSTIGESITVGCASACNVSFQNCEIFQIGTTWSSMNPSSININVKDSIIHQPSLKGPMKASIWGLKTGLQSNFKLSEHSSGSPLPEFVLENTVVKWLWAVKPLDRSSISVDDSTLEHHLLGVDNTTSKITNSTIGNRLMIYRATNSTIEFDNTTVESLWVYVPPNSVTMKGNVTFINNASVSVWRGPSTLKRNYPVTIMGDFGRNPPTANLSLFDKTGKMVWSGQTDAQGKADFDIEFNDDNHNDTWDLTIDFDGKRTTLPITLLTSTPIKVARQFNISVSSGLNGTISPSGKLMVNEGDLQTFQIQPSKFDGDRVQANGVYQDGTYRVSDVVVDGTSVGAVTSYTFNNVKGDHSINAIFTKDTPSGAVVTYDDFGSDTVDLSRWSANDVHNVFSLSSGYLNANTSINSNRYHLAFKQAFPGDFDIVLPYKDFQMQGVQPSTNGPSIGISINTPDGSWAQIWVQGSADDKLSVSTNSSSSTRGNGESITSPSGWLRMIRDGSKTLNTYYRVDDKWNILGSFPNYTGDVSVNIMVYSGNSGTFHVLSDGFYSMNPCVSPNVILSSYANSFASAGNIGSVNVTSSSSNCFWSATSNASWITVTSSSSGSGNGTVSYSVAANNGSVRTGTITISGQTFTITQQASASVYFDTVQKIFIGYYQRPADPAGLIYWAEKVSASNGNLDQIIDAFANSTESQGLYGIINSTNISTVVNHIYNALFARDAEPAGLEYWVGEFNSGRITAASIMLNLLNGAQNEDLQSVNNKLTAANLFTKVIDPELDGSNFQVTYEGDADVIAGRNFLTLNATSVKVPTQAETTAFIKANIADPGDVILTQ